MKLLTVFQQLLFVATTSTLANPSYGMGLIGSDVDSVICTNKDGAVVAAAALKAPSAVFGKFSEQEIAQLKDPKVLRTTYTSRSQIIVGDVAKDSKSGSKTAVIRVTNGSKSSELFDIKSGVRTPITNAPGVNSCTVKSMPLKELLELRKDENKKSAEYKNYVNLMDEFSQLFLKSNKYSEHRSTFIDFYMPNKASIKMLNKSAWAKGESYHKKVAKASKEAGKK